MSRFRDEKFTVGLIQMSCSADPNQNLEKIRWKIREAAAKGAQVICTQELFRSQYFCREENFENFALAECIPGPSTDALSPLAKELGVVIIASLFEKRTQGLYHNTAAVLGDDGELKGIYRKMHIPDDPLYYEKFYFTPGDLGFRNFATRFGQIGESPGCKHSLLSHRDRMAPVGEGETRKGTARRVAHHPARSRHRERSLCGGH